MIPHTLKQATGGEDAYFVGRDILVVADGVGGWNRHGIDPSKFSRQLCEEVGKYWNQDKQKYLNNLEQLMDISHKQVKHIGSSTLVIANIDPVKPQVNIQNIGDSGYMIFRIQNREIVTLHVSQDQQHQFNFPYQLSYVPGNQQPVDEAKDSQNFKHEIQHGDIIMVASDGVLDNIDSVQVSLILEQKLLRQNKRKLQEISDQDLMKELSDTIADKAFLLSQDPNYNSPFAQQARKIPQFGQDYMGGKQDDITVVIGKIIIDESNSNQQQQNNKQDL